MWRGGGWRGAATWRRAVVGAPRNATAWAHANPMVPRFAGRRLRDGDKTLVCAADNQGSQNYRLPVWWIGRRSSARARRGCVSRWTYKPARKPHWHAGAAAICVTLVADLVGSGALEDAIRVVGVAELALILPYVTGADETMAQVDVHQQIGLLRHADVADFEIGAAVALTRVVISRAFFFFR
jgi:hypothetical protein